MAQYSLQGVYGFAQPQFPPAKPTMVAPADPKSYNANYLPQSRFHKQETPIPRTGHRVPPPHSDLLGPSASKVSALPLKPSKPDMFSKYGRMRFESAIPAPVETSAEYKFLPFKEEAEVNFTAQNETPPTSIFSNMAPLELVERLIKGVTDPEKKEAFEAVRKYLMRIELLRVNRPLTTAEDAEYGKVVNGLRANALDAFGDGSTQFATQVAYDLGVRFGLMRSVPPAPAPPGIAAPIAPIAIPGPPAAQPFQLPSPTSSLSLWSNWMAQPVSGSNSMFMPPTTSAPTPGPDIATQASLNTPPLSPQLPAQSAPSSPVIARAAPSPTPAATSSSSSMPPLTLPATALPATAQLETKQAPVKKIPPEVRVMIAQDYLNQPTINDKHIKNAHVVIDNAGNNKLPGVKNAWDAMRANRKKIHDDRSWQGQWYKDTEFEAAFKAGLDHPSKLPKHAAPGPGESKDAGPLVGSGQPIASGSYLGNRKLRRGFNLDLEMSPSAIQDLADEMVSSHEWNPAAW